MIWIILFAVMMLFTASGAVFIIKRLSYFHLINYISRENRKTAYTVSSVIVIICAVAAYLTMGIWNVMLIFIHLMLIWLICDFVRKVIFKNEKKTIAGILAIVLTFIYMAWGWSNAYNVRPVYYNLFSEDLNGQKLRIVGFADSHVGTTFNFEKFGQYIDEINELQPDIVVISGDFVDDDSSKEDMIGSCRQLGRLKTRYGVYFVYGNHDKGYYVSKRGYTEAELQENLEKNGVNVLRDDIVHIVDNIYVLGRLDSRGYERKSMAELSSEYSSGDFIIVLDHEPNDYTNEAMYNADLVISGHTHGGQFFPINIAGEWLNINDATYGYELRGSTQFIVTSGISDWTFKFKTGCISEYLVIDIGQK